MKTKVEVLESGATKLTVTIEAAEIDARIKKTYKDFGAKYRFPGFRPGHVPRPVIDSNLGKDAVRSTVTDELLNESFPLAVDENDLNMISQPKFGDVEGLVEEGKDFTFSAEFEVKPALELSDYSPVHIEVPFKTASEAEIDEQIEALGNYYYDYKNAPANTKVKQENSVEITLVVKDDKGEVMESLGAEDRLYEMGQGLFPAAFDEALLGMKKGETKSITLNVAENPCMMTSILKDKTEEVTFEIEVKAVKKKVAPEVTDEWVKETLGFADVAELRVRMGESIEQQKGDIIPRIMENNALFALQERLIGEVPAVMAEEAERDLLQNFFTQLQNQGATLDAYLKAQDITADKFKEDVKLPGRRHRQAEPCSRRMGPPCRHRGFRRGDRRGVQEQWRSGSRRPLRRVEGPGSSAHRARGHHARQGSRGPACRGRRRRGRDSCCRGERGEACEEDFR